jgi:hypothetical protein
VEEPPEEMASTLIRHESPAEARSRRLRGELGRRRECGRFELYEALGGRRGRKGELRALELDARATGTGGSGRGEPGEEDQGDWDEEQTDHV